MKIQLAVICIIAMCLVSVHSEATLTQPIARFWNADGLKQEIEESITQLPIPINLARKARSEGWLGETVTLQDVGLSDVTISGVVATSKGDGSYDVDFSISAGNFAFIWEYEWYFGSIQRHEGGVCKVSETKGKATISGGKLDKYSYVIETKPVISDCNGEQWKAENGYEILEHLITDYNNDLDHQVEDRMSDEFFTMNKRIFKVYSDRQIKLGGTDIAINAMAGQTTANVSPSGEAYNELALTLSSGGITTDVLKEGETKWSGSAFEKEKYNTLVDLSYYNAILTAIKKNVQTDIIHSANEETKPIGLSYAFTAGSWARVIGGLEDVPDQTPVSF